MNRSSLALAGAVLLPLALSSCQTWAPTWSEVAGQQYNRAILNRFPTAIDNVDGGNPGPAYGGAYYRYYKVTPGTHRVELSALNPTPNWVPGINLQTTTIEFEPCRRYYVNAQFDNRLLTDWQPVIDYVEPIAGCRLPG